MERDQSRIEDIWAACTDVMRNDGKPLEIPKVAKACGWNEDDLIKALIEYTGPNNTSICFRFPPIPCAAITGMAARDGSYAVGVLSKAT